MENLWVHPLGNQGSKWVRKGFGSKWVRKGGITTIRKCNDSSHIQHLLATSSEHLRVCLGRSWISKLMCLIWL